MLNCRSYWLVNTCHVKQNLTNIIHAKVCIYECIDLCYSFTQKLPNTFEWNLNTRMSYRYSKNYRNIVWTIQNITISVKKENNLLFWRPLQKPLEVPVALNNLFFPKRTFSLFYTHKDADSSLYYTSYIKQ